MFSRLLVANRGEIAARIFRTARRMGLRTVAVYSSADAQALHLRCADEAICIGGPAATDSYLRGERIIEAALAAGADCIHPGYGFLSENADFAEAVAGAGLTFIGPPPKAIRAMGLKDRAKALMEAAGVPVTPGYHDPDQTPEILLQHARAVGFPLLVKAVAGGGGRGMRRVDAEADFAPAIEGARREALAAFGNGDLLLETFVRDPRHIEIQIFADGHGDVIHLFERDCSLQRRHQKVIEEAPAPGLTDVVRQAMGRAAIEAARAVGYVGAGTVEFIAEGGPQGLTGRFWFMEMNTRLQVEHPVTEAITGLDLVEWQIRVACGESLPLTQSDIHPTGHAVEARVYAEDPQAGFLPSTGAIHALRLPAGEGLRVDAGVAEGGVVSPWYDPMIAKVAAHGATRDVALDRLGSALAQMRVAGVQTNLAFLAALCAAPAFRKGDFDTGFIAQNAADLALSPQAPEAAAVRLGALALLMGEASDSSSPWTCDDGFQLGPPRLYGLRILVDGRELEAQVAWPGPRVFFGGGESGRDGLEAALADLRVLRLPACVLVQSHGRQIDVRPYDGAAAHAKAAGGDGVLRAPMHGRLARLAVSVGEQVGVGQLVAVIEAMKMEHSLLALRAGKIEELAGPEGAQIAQGALIARITDEDGGDRP